MSDFDTELKTALRDLDTHTIGDPIEDKGFYREAFASLRGPGSGLRIMAWVATIVFSMGLLFCLYKLIVTQDLRTMLIFAVFALLFNQAQIAMKLWFNTQLNRRAIIGEMRHLERLILDRTQ